MNAFSQVLHNGLIQEMDHPIAGNIAVPGQWPLHTFSGHCQINYLNYVI